MPAFCVRACVLALVTTDPAPRLLCFFVVFSSRSRFAPAAALHHPSAYLKHNVDPEICTVTWPQDDPPFLPSIGRSGMTVEVGPVAHSTVRAEVYEKTKNLLEHALDYIELHNQHVGNPSDASIGEVKVSLPLAERVANVDYPRDERGCLVAFVHPTLQGIPELNNGDAASQIRQGSPIFQTLGGETIRLDLHTYTHMEGKPWDTSAVYYPMFVNEAAYVEKGTAFFLTRMVEHDVTILERK